MDIKEIRNQITTNLECDYKEIRKQLWVMHFSNVKRQREEYYCKYNEAVNKNNKEEAEFWKRLLDDGYCSKEHYQLLDNISHEDIPNYLNELRETEGELYPW